MNDQTTARKIQAQESEYRFPYHYIPHSYRKWGVRRHRVLSWGMEYLCYQNHIINLIRGFEPERVLEVGCGDGYMIGHLGEDIPERVGADFSSRAIGFARAFNPDVTFHVGNASELEGGFDLVAAVEVIEHIPDEGVSDFLKTLFAQAKPGGKVVICAPSVVVPVNRKKHFRHYTAGLLREQLDAAGVTRDELSCEYVFRKPRWMKWFNKLTINRHWTFEMRALNRWLWHLIWTRYRLASERDGEHVVMVFQKNQ